MNKRQVPSSAQVQWNHTYNICFNSKEAKSTAALYFREQLAELLGHWRSWRACFPCIVSDCFTTLLNRLVIKDEI